MSDSLITVIAIMLTAVLLLVLPVMTMANRVDNISKTDVETMTSNFVNEIRTIGKLTSENYNKFIEELTSTGNTYDIEMEFKILDENPGKKSTQSAKDKIGENVYYSVFTTQIQEALNGENKVYNLKEGDIINVNVKNTNLTLAQSLKNFFYTMVGNDTYTIVASSSGIVLRTDDIELANVTDFTADTPDTPDTTPEDTKKTLASQVEIGDYVAYDATNNYKYTSPKGSGASHGNGDTAQTVTSSSNVKWRVFSKNTSTGEVVLISDDTINIMAEGEYSYYIYSAIGYLYAEEELNRVCSIYGKGKGADTSKIFTYTTGDLIDGSTTGTLTGSGARSINANDINQITGYQPSTGIQETHNIYYPTKKNEQGYSMNKAIRTDTNTAYNYNITEYLGASNIYNELLKGSYWLASRTITCIGNDYVDFNIMKVSYNLESKISCYTLFESQVSDVEINTDGEEFGVRPLVYLKTSLKAVGKNPNGAWIIEE